jgi:5-methyltetrahydropteroyltriglutamate--homocysteine methyltransferase
MAVVIELPILPVTSVGSFPKPAYLQQARIQFRRGEISYEKLHELELQATREVIAMQEEVGADLLVHGEMERGDMVEFFADQLEGFGRKGLVRSYGNRYYFKPVITGEIRRTKPMTVEMWQFAQSLTKKPVKVSFQNLIESVGCTHYQESTNQSQCPMEANFCPVIAKRQQVTESGGDDHEG